MKAAVMHQNASVPSYEDFPEPRPNDRTVLVNVRAASLKHIDKGIASGAHYLSQETPAMVCGVDGVGLLDDGRRVYFGGCPPPYGAMAEMTIAPAQWHFPVPDGLDDVTAAAIVNPAMSSWLPLTWRTNLVPGETVLILGATGVAGKLAIQIAKHLGAGRVVAAGRNPVRLSQLGELGADAIIQLDQTEEALAEAFAHEAGAGYDIVLDYLWGHPTEVLLAALTGHEWSGTAHRTRLIEIGALAAPTIALPAEALRSSGLEIYGSGGGSVPPEVIAGGLPRFLELATEGQLRIDTEQVPLAEVAAVWNKPPDSRRIVLIP